MRENRPPSRTFNSKKSCESVILGERGMHGGSTTTVKVTVENRVGSSRLFTFTSTVRDIGSLVRGTLSNYQASGGKDHIIRRKSIAK